MNNKSFISIIVPVRNAERTLDKTFQYLLNVEYPRELMEIVIADGGSSDGTLDVIGKWQGTHPFIKLVEIPNCPSPGFARNKALDVAKGDFLFFTDGDCAPCKEWITEILSHFQRDANIGIVGGEIYTLRVDPDNLTELYCEYSMFNMVAPRYGFIKEGYFPDLSDLSPTEIAGHRAYFFVTANVAYRRKALERAEARFWTNPTGEDIDMCLQIHKDGWKLYFAPKARVDHMHRADLAALRKVWVTYGMAHGPLIDKHAANNFEVVFQTLKKSPRVKLPFPIRGFIYLGNFHLMHIFGGLFVIGLITAAARPGRGSLELLTWLCLFLTLRYMYKFFKWCFYMRPKKRLLSWLKIAYLCTLSFIQGGLKGSKKHKAFCIEPSLY